MYECDRCGACCIHLIIEIEPVDIAREPKLRLLRPARIDPGWGPIEDDREEYERVGPLVPGFEAGAILACGATNPCPMLTLEKLCSIYPTRPTCCVAMQAGSDLCQIARKMARLPMLEPMS